MHLDLDQLAKLPAGVDAASQWHRVERMEVERVRGLDLAVGELAEYLGCERDEVFAQAQAGADDPNSKLCAQVLRLWDQREAFFVLCDLFGQTRIGGLLDYGHGSAALTLPFGHACAAMMVVDEPGEALDFAGWRARRHGLMRLLAVPADQAAAIRGSSFSFVVCLEPATQPEPTLARLLDWLSPGGAVMLSAEWEPWFAVIRQLAYVPLHEGRQVSVFARPSS